MAFADGTRRHLRKQRHHRARRQRHSGFWRIYPERTLRLPGLLLLERDLEFDRSRCSKSRPRQGGGRGADLRGYLLVSNFVRGRLQRRRRSLFDLCLDRGPHLGPIDELHREPPERCAGRRIFGRRDPAAVYHRALRRSDHFGECRRREFLRRKLRRHQERQNLTGACPCDLLL